MKIRQVIAAGAVAAGVLAGSAGAASAAPVDPYPQPVKYESTGGTDRSDLAGPLLAAAAVAAVAAGAVAVAGRKEVRG